MTRNSRGIYASFVGLIIIGILSCGRKGSLTVPRLVAPKAIEDLNYYFDNGVLVLKWGIPTENVDGSKLDSLKGFIVRRSDIPLSNKGCLTCPAPFKDVADIDISYPRNAKVSKRSVQYGASDLSAKHRYTYRVLSYTVHGNLSDGSNVVTLNWDTVPPPPSSISVGVGDREVKITWRPESDDINKEEIAGYRVYRRPKKEPYPHSPINDTLIHDNRFEDKDVENGTTYFYVVRSVIDVAGTLLEGINSHEVQAIPVDLTPPVPPRELVAIPFDWGIELRWERNEEPDVAGYYIYRKVDGEIFPQCINERMTKEVSYRDERVSPNKKYHYFVTAVDSSPHRNESQPSEEVVLEY
jgi:fibronectin type 3 domain-containing protein